MWFLVYIKKKKLAILKINGSCLVWLGLPISIWRKKNANFPSIEVYHILPVEAKG